jgi:hypothetical protein
MEVARMSRVSTVPIEFRRQLRIELHLDRVRPRYSTRNLSTFHAEFLVRDPCLTQPHLCRAAEVPRAHAILFRDLRISFD